VAHWWQSRFRYTGPGLDWRYEGVLLGYGRLYAKTGEVPWRSRLDAAVRDLIHGQRADGTYLASSFEINPRSLGTPHEAGASLGLLIAAAHTDLPSECEATALRNLRNLIANLWDGVGFNDRPGVSGRVPNKLATLAQALLQASRVSDAFDWRGHARAAMADVLRYQVKTGPLRGAIGQGTPGAESTYFPYYVARCVPALMESAGEFADERYAEAARQAVAFLGRAMNADGSWPQVLYGESHRVEWPRWNAGVGSILAAFLHVDDSPPTAALTRLLASQLPHGGFSTAEGFAARVTGRHRHPQPDIRDVMPVVGWNDKALAFLSMVAPDQKVPSDADLTRDRSAATEPISLDVRVAGRLATYVETPASMEATVGDEGVYLWKKSEPWAKVCTDAICVA